MIEQGKLFYIDGLQMEVRQVKQIEDSQYLITCKPFLDVQFDISESTTKLIEDISETKDKIVKSEMIASWFISAKAKLKQNVAIISSLKKVVLAGEIRRLQRAGESWEDIVNVLAFSTKDVFWSENLVKCYRHLSHDNTKSGISIYNHIKNNLLASIKEEKPNQEMLSNSKQEYDL